MAQFKDNPIIALTGETVSYDLAESVGPDLRIQELLNDDEKSSLLALPLSYRTAAGDADIRQLLAEQNKIQPHNIVLTVGGVHALFLLAFRLCGDGDQAVIMSPVFPMARQVLESVNADLRVLPLSFDNGYQIDLTAFRQTLSSRTRLVSLASPQNPSGVQFSRQTIAQVIEIMHEICPDAVLVLDLTYREATYGGNPTADNMLDISDKIVACSSLSKCHGAPGLRLGWAMSTNQTLIADLVTAKFNTVIACSAIDEFLALKVLQNSDIILATRRRFLADALSHCEQWVQGHREFLEWVKPDAGALCCLRLRHSRFDQTAINGFYSTLAQLDTRVGDGTWFGEERRVFRLGFATLSAKQFTEALKRLSRAVTVNASKTP